MEEPKDKNQGHNPIDLEKILLPQKEAQSPASAQRVNAGALLEQETQAKVGGFALSEHTAQPTDASPHPEKVLPETPPAAPTQEPTVKPLQTYKGDIESLVERKNVSVLDMAVAEQQKRTVPQTEASPVHSSWLTRAAYVSGGFLLIVVSVGIGAYIYSAITATAPVTPLQTDAPFIAVDDTKVVDIATTKRDELMHELDLSRREVSLSVGLVARLFVGTTVTGANGNAVLQETPLQTLLRTLAPNVPDTLTRTLTGTYLLGVHSFDQNQAFLVAQTDSYEVAYAGMLEWERTMRTDLTPLFERVPPVRANDVATSSASSTPTILASAFADRVVENYNSRVIQNEYGDIVLLWTFLDRYTLVIATNEYTLREIISRLRQAPSLGLPQ